MKYFVVETSSRNVFHSFRSQTLFLLLSINTKLSVAMRSSSLDQWVAFALYDTEKWLNSLNKIVVWRSLTLCLHYLQLARAKILLNRLKILIFSVLDNLSSVAIYLWCNLDVHPLPMFLVYFCQCLHWRTNNNQLIDSIELVGSVRQLYIRAHKLLQLHSKNKFNLFFLLFN